MRLGVMVGLGLLLAGCRGAAPPPVPFQLPVAWQVGDRLAVEVVRERVDSRGEEHVSGGRGTAPVEVVVTSHTGDSYVLHWTYGAVRLDGGPRLREPMATFVRRLSTLLDGKRLVIGVEPRIGKTVVKNLDEVTGWYRDAFVDLQRGLIASGAPRADAERLVATAGGGGGPEQVAAWSLELPRLFLRFVGAQLTPGDVVEYDDRLVVQAGGPPVAVHGRYVLEAVEPATRQATIVWRQHVDEEALHARTVDALTAAAARAGTPAPRPNDVPRTTAEDEGRWVMDTVTGWPMAVACTRASRTGNAGWVETTTMKVERRAAGTP